MPGKVRKGALKSIKDAAGTIKPLKGCATYKMTFEMSGLDQPKTMKELVDVSNSLDYHYRWSIGVEGLTKLKEDEGEAKIAVWIRRGPAGQAKFLGNAETQVIRDRIPASWLKSGSPTVMEMLGDSSAIVSDLVQRYPKAGEYIKALDRLLKGLKNVC